MCGFGLARRAAANGSRFESLCGTLQESWKSNFPALPYIGTCRAGGRSRNGSANLRVAWKPLAAIYPASRSPRLCRRFAATEPKRRECRRSPLARRENPCRGVIDTTVLVAGIAGFKTWRSVGNPSAALLHDWLENETFTWLVTEDVLTEYKEVLARLGVRRHLIGKIVNRLRSDVAHALLRAASALMPAPVFDRPQVQQKWMRHVIGPLMRNAR